MALNDDTKRDGFHFMKWLQQVVSGWSGGASKTYVKPAGGQAKRVKIPPSPALLLAKALSTDQIQSPLYRSRVEEAKRKNAMWQNDMKPLILEQLSVMFHKQNYDRMKLYPSEWSNILRRIVNDISILYESPASRYIEEEETQKQTKGSKEEDVYADKPEAKPVTEKGGEAEAEPPVEGAESDVPEEPPFPPKKPDDETGQPVGDEGSSDVPTDGNPINTGDPDIDGLADVLDLEGSNDPANETPLDKVLELVNIDTYLDLVEHMSRFHDAVWVRPYVKYEGTIEEELPLEEGQEKPLTETKGDPSKAKLFFVIYDPSNANVVPNPEHPTEALAFYYWNDELQPNGTLQKRIHFWTKETYWKLDEDWKDLYAEPNPYGRLPVTLFQSELPTNGGYFCNGMGKDLFDVTLEINVLRTMQSARLRDGSFKQLAIIGANEDEMPADQVMGGPTPLYIPGGDGAGANVLDMQPNLQEQTDVIDSRTLDIAGSRGISPNGYKGEGLPESGFAKKLDRDKILKENRRIRKFFIESEKDLYQLLATVLEQHPIEGLDALDPKAKFCIDFGEPKFEESPEAQAKIDAQDLEMHKTSIVDLLQRDNPDLSEVELVKLAYRNKRINEAFMTSEQMRLVDLLAQPEGAGGGFGGGGGGGPPLPGGKPPPPGGAKKAAPTFPPKGGKPPPFGAKK